MKPLFRALWVEESPEGAFTRRVIERSLDDLPAGEVLVRVTYSSLNYKDALSASGNRGVTRQYPHTPGIDAAGVVEDPGATDFRPGEPVLVIATELGVSQPGGYSQMLRVPADWLLRIPEGLTPRTAMAYGTAGFTAAMCVDRLLWEGVRPESGEILVTGATGGVGTMSTGILAREGFHVVCATGKPHEADLLRSLGASEIIHRDDLLKEGDRPLLHARWAGVVDTVGGMYISSAIRASKSGGVVCATGNVASPNLQLTVFPFILRGVNLIGIDATRPRMEERTRLWGKLGKEWALDVEQLASTVREVDLEHLPAEIDRILRGEQVGRVLVRVGD